MNKTTLPFLMKFAISSSPADFAASRAFAFGLLFVSRARSGRARPSASIAVGSRLRFPTFAGATFFLRVVVLTSSAFTTSWAVAAFLPAYTDVVVATTTASTSVLRLGSALAPPTTFLPFVSVVVVAISATASSAIVGSTVTTALAAIA